MARYTRGLCKKAVSGETAAAAMALGAAVPLSRNAYKIEIAKTLIKRALLICSGQENGQGESAQDARQLLTEKGSRKNDW